MLKSIVLIAFFSMQQHHVTMTSIEHMPDSGSIKLFLRLDYNLFLKDYQQTINDDIDLEPFRKGIFPENLTDEYINSKIIIHGNGKRLAGKLIKMEKTGDNICLSFNYRAKTNLKTLKVRNTILTGLYSDIENLTIIKTRNNEAGVKFNQQYLEETFAVK